MYHHRCSFQHTMPVSRHNKEYIADQYRAAIKQLEDITGRAFDYDKFFKVQEQVHAFLLLLVEQSGYIRTA